MPSPPSPPPFALAELELQGPQRGVAVRGELDTATVPALRAKLEALVEAGPHRLVVDLSELSFVDSSGVTALLATRDQLRTRGGTLATICPDPHVRRTFELTGTDALLGVAGSRQQALGRRRPRAGRATAAVSVTA